MKLSRFSFSTSFKQELNGLSYSKQVYTNLGLSQSNKDYTNPQTLSFPSPIRIIQTYKQIAFQNKNVVGYSLNLVSSIDRDMCRALMNLDRSSFCRGGIETCLEQLLSNLHIFNLTTCNDHLEPSQIYPNISKVRFIK